MAPSIPGTNFLTKAEDKLIGSLARLASVQAFLGVDSVDAARGRIYGQEIPRSIEDCDEWSATEWAGIFPCVIVGPPTDGPEFSGFHSANSENWDMLASFAFSVRFERQRPESADEQEAAREVRNAIGNIIEEMIETNGEQNGFQYSTIRPAGPMYRGNYARESQMGIVEGMKLDVTYEVEGGGGE